MTWNPEEYACYGIDCARHAECARYQAVDWNSNHQQQWMGFCTDYSKFIPIADSQARSAEVLSPEKIKQSNQYS